MNADSPAEPSREELIALIAAQAAEIAALKAQIAELERRLGLNSSDHLPTEWVKTGGVLRFHADFKGFLVN
jgi:hypothetical protein